MQQDGVQAAPFLFSTQELSDDDLRIYSPSLEGPWVHGEATFGVTQTGVIPLAGF